MEDQNSVRRMMTAQERIDEETMRISNPNILGSGYIQHPPQRPFQQRIVYQPPSVAHLQYPQEFADKKAAANDTRQSGEAPKAETRPVQPASYQPPSSGGDGIVSKAYVGPLTNRPINSSKSTGMAVKARGGMQQTQQQQSGIGAEQQQNQQQQQQHVTKARNGNHVGNVGAGVGVGRNDGVGNAPTSQQQLVMDRVSLERQLIEQARGSAQYTQQQQQSYVGDVNYYVQDDVNMVSQQQVAPSRNVQDERLFYDRGLGHVTDEDLEPNVRARFQLDQGDGGQKIQPQPVNGFRNGDYPQRTNMMPSQQQIKQVQQRDQYVTPMRTSTKAQGNTNSYQVQQKQQYNNNNSNSNASNMRPPGFDRQGAGGRVGVQRVPNGIAPSNAIQKQGQQAPVQAGQPQRSQQYLQQQQRQQYQGEQVRGGMQQGVQKGGGVGRESGTNFNPSGYRAPMQNGQGEAYEVQRQSAKPQQARPNNLQRPQYPPTNNVLQGVSSTFPQGKPQVTPNNYNAPQGAVARQPAPYNSQSNANPQRVPQKIAQQIMPKNGMTVSVGVEQKPKQMQPELKQQVVVGGEQAKMTKSQAKRHRKKLREQNMGIAEQKTVRA